MNDFCRVAVIVDVIDIRVFGRMSGSGLVAVYLSLNNVDAVAYHGSCTTYILQGCLDKLGGFLEAIKP